MAILWFGGMDRYIPTTALVALPTYRAQIPFPSFKGIRLRLNGSTCGYRVAQYDNILETGVKRNWLHIQSTNNTKNNNTQYFEMSLVSLDIPDEYKEVDTIICLGYRFRTGNVSNSYRYLSFNKLTGSQNLNLGLGGQTGVTTVFPLEAEALHPLNNINTQEKYIEWRIRYRENNVCLIKLFVNKDLVYSTEVGWDEHWAITGGSPRSVGVWRYATSNGDKGISLFNDIYMSVDRKGDKVTTGMMGPVTAKALELEEVEFDGDWTTSNPNKDIKTILSEPLKDQSAVMTGDYAITDPGDREARFRFKPPIGEKLKIVGFQQGFIAQQPLAYSTSLQYAQTINGEIVDSSGWKTTVNVALEPNFSHIRSDAISVQPNGKDLTAEFLGTIGFTINSTKKLIEDDPPPPEDEIIEETEE